MRRGARSRSGRQGSLKPDAPWLQDGMVHWAGVEDKYFAAVFVPAGPTAGRARFELLRLVEDGKEEFHLSLALACRASPR